jgi:hypothetical protein
VQLGYSTCHDRVPSGLDRVSKTPREMDLGLGGRVPDKEDARGRSGDDEQRPVRQHGPGHVPSLKQEVRAATDLARALR